MSQNCLVLLDVGIFIPSCALPTKIAKHLSCRLGSPMDSEVRLGMQKLSQESHLWKEARRRKAVGGGGDAHRSLGLGPDKGSAGARGAHSRKCPCQTDTVGPWDHGPAQGPGQRLP